jgi:hypothetical protein
MGREKKILIDSDTGCGVVDFVLYIKKKKNLV